MSSTPLLIRFPPSLAGLLAGGTIATGALLAGDWQSLLAPEVCRWSGLALGLLITGSAIAVDQYFRRRELQSVQRHMDLLAQLDHNELTASDLADLLPSLAARNRLAPLFQQFVASLRQLAGRLQDSEQARAGGEVRLRKVVLERQQIADILQGLSMPVVAVDQYGELLLLSQSAAELLGTSRTGERRLPAGEALRCQALVDLLTDTRRRKHPAQRCGEMEITDAQGVRRVFRVTCRSLLMAEGGEAGHTEIGAVAILADMTDLKAVQKRHAEFVSAVSHEMKTPLAGIKAYVELLADGEAEDEETREQFLEVINGQADRLQRLIDNMLNLARIEAGVVSVNKQTLSLNELLEEALRVMQPAAENKTIQLESELSHLYLRVLGDRDMLLQVAFNLLSNAIKYTSEGGRVVLRSRAEDGQVIFEVQDTGVGLSAEDVGKVFEKFYRVKKDQGMASGTGLGLPLAKHIVEDVHGGQLKLSSELGVGSTFRVTLASGAG